MSSKNSEIGNLATKAMLCELAATPKPGLVDRRNNGAHRDMDFFTFLDSTAALAPYFDDFARIGAETAHDAPQAAMKPLRQKGLAAERAMFAATGGVNTHKGMIFSLGLVCGAAGRHLARREQATPARICAAAAAICSGICREAFAAEQTAEDPTKGERTYRVYGLKGVRGEAEGGFRSVLEVSLPCYLSALETGLCVNDALVETLLHLISTVQDTNVISRHDLDASAYAMGRARTALSLGGVRTPSGQTDIERMDRDFIERNISPGGSADLLAITYFLANLAWIEGGDPA